MNVVELICRIILLGYGTTVAVLTLIIGFVYFGDRLFRHVVALGIAHFGFSALCFWMISTSKMPRDVEVGIALVMTIIGTYGLIEIYHKTHEYLRRKHRGEW